MPDGKLVRVYQGRVGSLEANPPASLDELWAHHDLFQDAVNYYLVALAALAAPGGNSPMSRLRSQMAGCWEPFRRGERRFKGLRDSIAPYLPPGSCARGIETACTAILAGNPVSPAILNDAVSQLAGKLKGESQVQQIGRSHWPMLCSPATRATFQGEPNRAQHDAARKWLPFYLHDPETTPEGAAARLRLHWFANLAKGKPHYTADRARVRLREAVKALRSADHNSDFDRLDAAVGGLEVEFPAYMAGGAGAATRLARVNAFLLLKYVEASDFTLGRLRNCYHQPKPGAVAPPAPEEAGGGSGDPGDPIQCARGERGYVFPAFTSLPAWGSDGVIQWSEFDIAALKEALKTINQVQQKTVERQEQAAKIQQMLDWMEQKEGSEAPGADKDDENEQREISVLGGDPRWELAKELLATELAEEPYLAPGETAPYGLARRTLRGFHELREKWRKVVKSGQMPADETAAKLLKITVDFQTANRDRIGSVNLFRALTDPKYWPLWEEPTDVEQLQRTKCGFAGDVLDTHCRYLEQQADLERLREPVRFTPADPSQSRRQFLFSDLKGKSEPKHHANAPDGGFRVEVSLARRTGGRWAETRAILRYTAPRLLRDGLRRAADENLERASWLTPMVAALDPPEPTAQDFRKAPLGLFPDRGPDGTTRALLNFPLALNPDFLSRLRGGFAWEQQLAAYGKRGQRQRFYLRWPAQQGGEAAANGWWQHCQEFRCLAVDLGQRDAGAFAHLRARAAAGPANGAAARFIGNDGAQDWFASVAACGLMRLPGEDAAVWRGGQWAQELSGEKGRLACPGETAEADAICQGLGQDPAEWLGPHPARLSFPRQNTQLLRALRRAQADLARCHRWLWMLGDDQKRARALDEIGDLDPAAAHAEWRAWAATGQLAPLADALRAEIARRTALLTLQLAAIANRCLPLRGHRWAWRAHPDAEAAQAGCHALAMEAAPGHHPWLAGQRGLSMERIEQIEMLRRSCQSLNKALQRVPGAPPPRAKDLRDHPLPDPCPEILAKLDRMKRQRVNQTAHWILAEALGVRPKRHAMPKAERVARDQHAEYERIPGRSLADFIVLEDLSRYLSSQDRPPRENGRLMQWCHRQILAKVKELAEPFGIPVLETPPAYSSRFCSRTGAAGFRAVEVTPEAAGRWPWREILARPDDERHGRAAALFAWLRAANQGRGGKKPHCLLAPDRGGPLFVSLADRPRDGGVGRSRPPRWVTQADVNAAINLGLRAIAAPDVAEIHVRIRTEAKNGGFLVRAGSAREKARWSGRRPPVAPRAGDDFGTLIKDSPRPNFFADVAVLARFDRATIAGLQPPVASGKGLWTAVRQQEWECCREINQARMDKWRVALPAAAAAPGG